jgi:hypothetical protein
VRERERKKRDKRRKEAEAKNWGCTGPQINE